MDGSRDAYEMAIELSTPWQRQGRRSKRAHLPASLSSPLSTPNPYVRSCPSDTSSAYTCTSSSMAPEKKDNTIRTIGTTNMYDVFNVDTMNCTQSKQSKKNKRSKKAQKSKKAKVSKEVEDSKKAEECEHNEQCKDDNDSSAEQHVTISTSPIMVLCAYPGPPEDLGAKAPDLGISSKASSWSIMLEVFMICAAYLAFVLTIFFGSS